MTEELSGVTVVIIIGLGFLTFLSLFIFAKRQIMRFSLRSRRGPHVPLGHNAKKVLKREIERRIDHIPKIVTEPQLIQSDPRYIVYPGHKVPCHYYRFKAVDDLNLLEQEIKRQDNFVRHPNVSIRGFLLTTLADPLKGNDQRLIHQFCDLYEHARHDPSYFGEYEYQAYNRLLYKLIDTANLLKLLNINRSLSPNRTPQKQRNRNLLDPSRLKHISKIDEISGLKQVQDGNRSLSRVGSVAVPPIDSETSV